MGRMMSNFHVCVGMSSVMNGSDYVQLRVLNSACLFVNFLDTMSCVCDVCVMLIVTPWYAYVFDLLSLKVIREHCL